VIDDGLAALGIAGYGILLFVWAPHSAILLASILGCYLALFVLFYVCGFAFVLFGQ
jgi:hypothetical protein